jgi:hypothetical protein
MISQTDGVEHADDAQHDSDLPAELSGEGGVGVDSSAHLLRELELLSDAAPAAVSPPATPPVAPPPEVILPSVNSSTASPPSASLPSAGLTSANPPSVARSKRMSSMSEQDHLNPRDPLYYAPRSLRERSASRGGSLELPYTAASFDSQLENAVSDALRHPLDPELMHEPRPVSKKGMWTVAARFAAAIGVAALVALFFVVGVPGLRQSEGEQASFANFAQSVRNALPQPGDGAQKPAINDFQALLAATPASAPPTASEPPSQLLQQFMQWREKPDPAAQQRTNP